MPCDKLGQHEIEKRQRGYQNQKPGPYLQRESHDEDIHLRHCAGDYSKRHVDQKESHDYRGAELYRNRENIDR